MIPPRCRDGCATSVQRTFIEEGATDMSGKDNKQELR